MAKMYFRFGTVGSAKTLNLLAVAHNYTLQKKRVLLLKPAIDVRFAHNFITSRTGLKREADYLIESNTLFLVNNRPLISQDHGFAKEINLDRHENLACILVDEAQFLSQSVIDQLHLITIQMDIPVLCYGLKTNFKSHLFAGSRRIIELADKIEEIKSTCYFCKNKAIFNLKLINGVPVNKGAEVDLGAEEKYRPACKDCYRQKLN